MEITEEENVVDGENNEEKKREEKEEKEGEGNDDKNVISEGVAIPTVTHEIVDMSEDSPEDSEEHSEEHSGERSSVLSTPVVSKTDPKGGPKVTAKRVRPSRAKGAAAKRAKMSADAITVTPCAKGGDEREEREEEGGVVEGSTVELMECEGDDVTIVEGVEGTKNSPIPEEHSVEGVVECSVAADTDAIVIEEGVSVEGVKEGGVADGTTEATPTPATTNTTTTTAAKRKRKTTPTAAAAAAKINEKAAIDLESEVQSPEVAMKLQCHQDRVKAAVGELLALER